jgi:hypothetical protein
MCFDALGFAVTALAFRNDVANFFEAARQRIALAALTPKRSAACRQDKPPSIAATTLWRRSTESALVIHADLLRQHVS